MTAEASNLMCKPLFNVVMTTPTSVTALPLPFLSDSPLLAVATVGPSELARLKEKALEYNRLKEQMEALKDDVSTHVTGHLPSCAIGPHLPAYPYIRSR